MDDRVEVWGWPVERWEVLGIVVQAGALLLAVIGALYAARQFWLSRDVRADQSRPYMVIGAKPGVTSESIIDIVVANIGTTPATDLTISVDPPLVGAVDRNDEWSLSKARIFNETIPMWPPGHEVRAFFDSAFTRADSGADLPTVHTATLTYGNGRRGKRNRWRETSIIDLDLNKGMTYTATYGIHHAAEALVRSSGSSRAHRSSRPRRSKRRSRRATSATSGWLDGAPRCESAGVDSRRLRPQPRRSRTPSPDLLDRLLATWVRRRRGEALRGSLADPAEV